MYRILGPGFPLATMPTDSEVFAIPSNRFDPQMDVSRYSMAIMRTGIKERTPTPAAVQLGGEGSSHINTKRPNRTPDATWHFMPQFSSGGQVHYIPISDYYKSVGEYYLRQPQIYHQYKKDDAVIVLEEHKIEHGSKGVENFVYTKRPFVHYENLTRALEILKLTDEDLLEREYLFLGMHFENETLNITFNSATKVVTCSNPKIKFSNINSLDELKISLGKQIVEAVKTTMTAAGIDQIKQPFPAIATGLNLQYLDAGEEGEIYRLIDLPHQCIKRFFRIGDIPDQVMTFLHMQQFINQSGLSGVRMVRIYEVGNDYIRREFVPHQLRDLSEDHLAAKQAEDLIEQLTEMTSPLAILLRKVLRNGILTIGNSKATQSNIGIDDDNMLVIYDLL